VVWGSQGKDTATCDQFFAELGADRAAKLAAVSTDMAVADLKSVATPGHAQRDRVYRPVPRRRLASDALDQVRRQVWNQRRAVDPAQAKNFKGARWCCSNAPSV
jgi:transposase